MLRSVLALTLLVVAIPALPLPSAAAAEPAYGPELEGFEYPFPVERFTLTSQRQPVQMAYLDVRPATPNGRTAVLLHGKNFCAATWESQIRALTEAGYRVIAPDQIGFCKSSKPAAYQFTFRQLAENTHALLDKLGVARPILVGHSTGGMLAAHYALLYPKDVAQLVLVNPIGLEDWSAKGVPPVSVEQWYQRELKVSAASIRAYETATYYAGQWEPRYEPWVTMLAGLNAGPGKEAVAWDSALLYDMILTQPVVYRLPQIAVPTLLMIGQKDNTAIGKDLAPPELRASLGNYPELGKAAAKAIPGAKLVEFPVLGHAPQMSDPEGFNTALIAGISAP
ncbi:MULTISPECIES: alpha/beta fold hydrolase [Methylobacterium]|uniref:alpha/beta fold hydrolase n=1 Tax=Methylobacterium TaxID=407 RepID=UPI0011CCAFDB|nr:MULTISPECIES: alpha/beta hydrolase [Methylobacterium]TXN46246.1 alpha/beta hydrolase [Methylobacterium sp. WL7]TXN63944.1 alpha/beta hydrolase [Methylobacterium sp. WL18]GJE21968.1 4,5:9,10-diseco-3-hydroxy-5,9, 17-trioxoandrosta-1(10),2-diene-4-oate hydrolase [Methylobacterium mesophilicum]